MKLSEKKQQELYGCIYEAVIKLRVKIARKVAEKSVTIYYNEIDKELHDLEFKIWDNIKKVLNIT